MGIDVCSPVAEAASLVVALAAASAAVAAVAIAAAVAVNVHSCEKLHLHPLVGVARHRPSLPTDAVG